MPLPDFRQQFLLSRCLQILAECQRIDIERVNLSNGKSGRLIFVIVPLASFIILVVAVPIRQPQQRSGRHDVKIRAILREILQRRQRILAGLDLIKKDNGRLRSDLDMTSDLQLVDNALDIKIRIKDAQQELVLVKTHVNHILILRSRELTHQPCLANLPSPLQNQ